jgi:hypothetical protein
MAISQTEKFLGSAFKIFCFTPAKLFETVSSITLALPVRPGELMSGCGTSTVITAGIEERLGASIFYFTPYSLKK